MADLVFSDGGEFLAVVCNTGVKVLNLRDGSCKFSHTVTSEPQNTQAVYDDSATLGHSVLCCFSRSRQFFALCTPEKELLLWRTSDWKLLNKRDLVRRTTVVLFTHKEDYIVAANKGGDVYRFSVSDAIQEKELLLGHVSMILDMVITKDDKFLITADRDEKIRISNYPNSYNIQSFCLGHLDFVSCLTLLPGSQAIVASGGGDGTVRFWNPEEGKQITCNFIGQTTAGSKEPNLKEEPDSSPMVSCLACCQKNSVVCALIERSRKIHLCHTSGKQNTTLPTLEADVPPWHATFDPEGRLWCVQPHPEEPVLVFEARGDLPNIEYTKLPSDSLPVLTSAGDWSFLKGCLNQERKLATLRKREVDNISEYRARKEVWMERKKNKQATNGASASQDSSLENIAEIEAKRPRLET